MSDDLKVLEESLSRLDKLLTNKIKPYFSSLQAIVNANHELSDKDKENIESIKSLLEKYELLEEKLLHKDKKLLMKDKSLLKDFLNELNELKEIIKELKSILQLFDNREVVGELLSKVESDENHLEKEIKKVEEELGKYIN